MRGKLYILLLMLVISVLSVSSKDVTTRKKLKVDRKKIEWKQPAEADTIRTETVDSISFAGFDKPLRSTYETVFVTNHSSRNIVGIVFECNYTDMSGRQLHKQTVKQKCTIPAGQTRQLRFKSWDLQNSFYYELSTKPRRADGTPFKVKCRCLAIVTPKAEK